MNRVIRRPQHVMDFLVLPFSLQHSCSVYISICVVYLFYLVFQAVKIRYFAVYLVLVLIYDPEVLVLFFVRFQDDFVHRDPI